LARDPIRAKEWKQEYQIKNKKRIQEYGVKYRERAKKEGRKLNYSTERRWVDHLRYTFKITPEVYNQMLAEQGDCCAICKKRVEVNPGAHSAKGRYDIDHNHTTKKIRGLLCKRCNRGLGAFYDSIDSLQAAIDYLKRTDG
jgi:hypothetical protein